MTPKQARALKVGDKVGWSPDVQHAGLGEVKQVSRTCIRVWWAREQCDSHVHPDDMALYLTEVEAREQGAT